MNIDPKQIAKMITEDPDEVNPLDNIEDRFGPTCDVCEAELEGDGSELDFLQCEYCSAKICDVCAYHHGHHDLEDLQRQHYNADRWYINVSGLHACPDCINTI